MISVIFKHLQEMPQRKSLQKKQQSQRGNIQKLIRGDVPLEKKCFNSVKTFKNIVSKFLECSLNDMEMLIRRFKRMRFRLDVPIETCPNNP